MHLDLLHRAGSDGFGTVADVGCGRGQAGVLLLEAGVARAVTGLDRARRALADARLAAAGLPYVAKAQDLAADPSSPPCDTALLIDVLYQLRPDEAGRLLAASAASARRRVLVRTFDAALGWRSFLALALEQFARLGWPTSGRHVDPLPVSRLCAVLEHAGFAVNVSPCRQGTPFANVLIDARRG